MHEKRNNGLRASPMLALVVTMLAAVAISATVQVAWAEASAPATQQEEVRAIQAANTMAVVRGAPYVENSGTTYILPTTATTTMTTAPVLLTRQCTGSEVAYFRESAEGFSANTAGTMPIRSSSQVDVHAASTGPPSSSWSTTIAANYADKAGNGKEVPLVGAEEVAGLIHDADKKAQTA